MCVCEVNWWFNHFLILILFFFILLSGCCLSEDYKSGNRGSQFFHPFQFLLFKDPIGYDDIHMPRMTIWHQKEWLLTNLSLVIKNWLVCCVNLNQWINGSSGATSLRVIIVPLWMLWTPYAPIRHPISLPSARERISPSATFRCLLMFVFVRLSIRVCFCLVLASSVCLGFVWVSHCKLT